MGLSFGLYHLIYAVATWPRKGSPPLEQRAVE
jgi:hypothetical protein